MEALRREILVFTPGKQYSGEVDIPNADFRTTDLLNSSSLFWKDPAEKNFSDVLLMFNVTLSIDGIKEFQTFDRVQIRLPNIIFFHDNLANLGNAKEKIRAETLKAKTQEEKKTIHLITRVRFNSFFEIEGSFHGLFKSKSVQRYLPLSDVVMHEIVKQPDSWKKKKIHLANNFLGVNTDYIESCVFD